MLTGVKPTGIPHLGNYLGAIKPAIDMAKQHDSFLFIADLHALTVRPDPDALRNETYGVAAAWLALGLNPEQTIFYRQSDLPEIPLLSWILSCSLPLGYLNRAHSFKDQQAKGHESSDLSHGLYSYPLLMAADILLFDTDLVPVGKDQKQHLEIAQEIARKVNHHYAGGQELIKVPEALIDESVMTIPGLDGRKMSKSYDNTLTPFMDRKALKKAIKKLVTDSTEYGQPLPVEGDLILQLIGLLQPQRLDGLKAQYESGRKDPSIADQDLQEPSNNYFGWGDAKAALIDSVSTEFEAARSEYERLMASPQDIEALLAKGAARARAVARPMLKRVLEAVGLSTVMPFP